MAERRVGKLKKEIEDLKKEIQNYRDERLRAVNKISSCFAELEEEYQEHPDPISQIVDFCDHLYRERQAWNLEVQRCNEEKGEEIWLQKQELAQKDRELSDAKALLQAKDEELGDAKALLQAKDKELGDVKAHLLEKANEGKVGEYRLEENNNDSLGNFRSATDDVLKVKFSNADRLIKVITEPLGLGLSTTSKLSVQLPGKSLHAQGTRTIHFLNRGLIWSIVVDGFFSMPYGFGALGPDSGRQQLLDIYEEWLRPQRPGKAWRRSHSQSHGPNFEVFKRDKNANEWRSATFQIIIAAVNRSGGESSPAIVNAASAYWVNCKIVEHRVLKALEGVATVVLDSMVRASVFNLVCLVGELALEFGAQRSELGLKLVERDDIIRLGGEFVDCEGVVTGGTFVKASLMICPSLFGVGDGGSDLSSRRILVPGQVFRQRA